MTDLEHVLGDGVADGRLTVRDADQVRAFGQFLSETPRGEKFADPAERAAWKARWLPWLLGESDGPEPAEDDQEGGTGE